MEESSFQLQNGITWNSYRISLKTFSEFPWSNFGLVQHILRVEEDDVDVA